MYLEFIKHRKIFYGLSIFLSLASVASILFFGLKLGIDFTGGAVLELFYEESVPSFSDIKSALSGLELGDIS